VKKLRGGPHKYKERKDSGNEEESLCITMDTKPIDEENEDNLKEKLDSEEVNLEAELVSALEERQTWGKEYKAEGAIAET